VGRGFSSVSSSGWKKKAKDPEERQEETRERWGQRWRGEGRQCVPEGL
jgi:hypothetical protein